ncbi:MAG: hypothetical protein MK193_15295 [Lentisphaeria bacterium]|nr:hypothetical protein [Lentisphaeria bacterium]MCH2192182.1 hypothetical protein [Gammaproteobacteria bacterium]
MADKSGFITLLRYLGMILPGDFIKTFFYLNFIAKPRKFIRLCLDSFYRMDHIYEVLSEFNNTYKGNFSVLEFGVADGYAFTKKLYATHYLKMSERVIVHGFDTFDGMPDTDAQEDQDMVANDGWVTGQFKASYTNLDNYCSQRYKNYKLHQGYFEDTLTQEYLDTLKDSMPILIWIDCDYYTSTKSIFEKLIPFIPTGCVIYFDEYEFNFGSTFTGEARAVKEINEGKFGPGIELILDHTLSLNSRRVYRFINSNIENQFQRYKPLNTKDELRLRTNDSPLP